MKKIDSHHHFWNYEPEEYSWIEEDWKVLKKNFGVAELETNLATAGIDGAISVQARTRAAENDFLCDIADQSDLIRGVVGYVDLTAANAHELLEEFSSKPKAAGVREVLQGKEDDAFCLRKDFNAGVALLKEFGLAYDILIFHRHLPHATALVDQHPDQIFILDHIAKPNIAATRPDPKWIEGIRELAKRENVLCKISGMVTEVTTKEKWTPGVLKPYFEETLTAFGPSRIMFGSDWPVCLLESDYQKWVETAQFFTNALSESEKEMFWGGNAIAAYFGI